MAIRRYIPLLITLAVGLCWQGDAKAAGEARGSGPCAKCHDTAARAAKLGFVHGPVAVAQCATCHTPHRRGGRSKLVVAGPRLCFRCHDVKRLGSRGAHGTKKNLGCVACHQPHASKHRFFVRDGKRLCQRCHKSERAPKYKRSKGACWHAFLPPLPSARTRHAAKR